MNSRILAEGKQFELAIERCCYQLIEEFEDRTEIFLVGIQSGGVQLAERLLQKMAEIDTKLKTHLGKLDITFYRDDFRKSSKPLRAHENVMPFFIENKIGFIEFEMFDIFEHDDITLSDAFFARHRCHAQIMFINRICNNLTHRARIAEILIAVFVHER